MVEKNVLSQSSIVRLFTTQPDRLAAAWRRLRFEQGDRNRPPVNLLDSVVEPFVRELGNQLTGSAGSAWTRCTGVLRLSPERGARGIYEEFAALRRCLNDALEVLGAEAHERAIVNASLDEAVDAAIAALKRLANPAADEP